jgi:predicted transcriptional regulator
MASVPFSMRIDPAIKRALEAQARREKRSTAFVLQQAASDYLARQARMRAMVSEIEKEADKGEFISEDAMTKWFLSLGTENELPEPEPDVFVK